MTAGGPYRIGQRFGPYVLDAYLGAGAFKSVYRARNEGSVVPDPIVALGFPHQQDAEGIAELEREVAATTRLVHPNIIRVYGLERHDDITLLVMEYLEGRTLRAELRERGFLPPAEAVRYVGLVAEALAAAHAQYVFHRDVKPDNVFLADRKTPKVLDFGIARILAQTLDRASTRIGTAEYMAPEVLQGAAGTNADLWALGVTLYELLTGTRPFAGEMVDVIQQILAGKYNEAPLREKGVDTRIVRVLRKLLRKDPEERYQTATELLRDLEVAARRVRMVDDDEGRLDVLIRASYPLLYVYSFEEDRVVSAVRSIAARLSEERGQPRKIYVWSASRGMRDGDDVLVRPDTLEDPTSTLVHAIENQEDAIYLLLDAHHHFTPVTTRLIRDAARAVRMTRKSVIFVSPFFQAPLELEKDLTLVVFHLPDRQQFEPLLNRVAEECLQDGLPVAIEDADRAAIYRAAMGLTMNEAERALRAAIADKGGLLPGTDRAVVLQKTQIIRKSGLLEYYHNPESFDDVGGLDVLRQWFRSRAPVFSGAARYAGLPQPKGVLLLGVPGCGKSLSARALASEWGVPLLRLDIGRVFGPLVGAAEANMRRAIQTAEAVSPCVLWIDEVEKGFAGVQSHSGGGVAARVFGWFLNWLQDKKSPVFVVATANDLRGIPPEFLRGGRFDEKFFVGLPDRAQRERILAIHLARRKREPAEFDLQRLAHAGQDCSGAELEQAVVGGLYRAFDAGRELTSADVADELASTHPLARSRAPEIGELVRWAEDNARNASERG